MLARLVLFVLLLSPGLVLAQAVTGAPGLGTVDALADPTPGTLLGAVVAALLPGLLWWIRRRLVGRLGEAVAEAVTELAPLAEEYRRASADGRLSPEEREHLRERAVLAGLGAVGILGRVLLVGPMTAGKLVELHVERAKGVQS